MGRSRDFLALTKPRVILMVLVTTSVGFYLGSQGPTDRLRLLQTLLGTALAAAGTIALNQYLEREVDARMERTRRRPLPQGRLQPAEALRFGVAITAAGILLLLGVGPLASLVTAATVGLYLFAYTPLKRCSSLCLVVGAASGALPPVTGWVEAHGDFGIGGWVLFGILFLWQLPHTPAIARLYQEDYARGGSGSFRRAGRAPTPRLWPVAWHSSWWGCCRRRSASPGRCTSSGPSRWGRGSSAVGSSRHSHRRSGQQGACCSPRSSICRCS